MNLLYNLYSYLRIIPYKSIEYIKNYINGVTVPHTHRLYEVPVSKRITNHITNLFLEPTHIIDNIYLGNAYNASNYATISKYNIKHIVNVTKEIKNYYEQQNNLPNNSSGDFYDDINNVEIKDFNNVSNGNNVSISVYNYNTYNNVTYLRVPIYDDSTYHITDYIKESLEFINNAHSTNCNEDSVGSCDGNILIHCYMGSSRSASIVLAYLIYKYNYSLEHALLFLKNKRNIVNINVNFINDIKTYFSLEITSQIIKNGIIHNHE
jgi:protein-tyrosine phosphatase